MFEIGPSELLLVCVIGLLVLGPKRLPKVAAEIGKWVGRARRTATQLRRQLEREIELSEIEKPDPPAKPPTSPTPPTPPTLPASSEAAAPPAPTAPPSEAAKSGNGAADPQSDEARDNDGHKIGGRAEPPPPFDPTEKPEV